MSTKVCAECGARYNAKTCPKCGSTRIATKNPNGGKDYNKFGEYQVSRKNPKMIICPDCGKEISKSAKSCPNCGNRIIQYNDNGKKKDSVLGIIAAICALFTVTSSIGIILGIIDLIVNANTNRHLGSGFAIIYGLIAQIVLCLMIF